MYRKRDKNQLTMEEFYLPFGEGLRSDNRWIRMSRLTPWDLVEEIYADRLSAEKGRAALPSRIAFGVLYIKEQENLTDAGTVMYLSENPYAQYFVGLKEFRAEPLFDASMMVHFRKRFGPEMLAKINERLYEQTNPQEKDPPDVLGGESPADGTGTQEDSCANPEGS